MTPVQRAYIELHIAVLLFGFTAILGKLIQLPAISIVWWRVLITSISLLLLIRGGSKLKHIAPRLRLQFMGIGILVGLHWLTFYGAVKLSNASLTLVCFATTSFFTSIAEPIILRRPFSKLELGLSLLIIPGMALIFNHVKLDQLLGMAVGIASAFLAALFGTFNKKLIGKTDELSITFLELSSAWLFISLILPFLMWQNKEPLTWLPSTMDWVYLMILALVCTTFAYVLALRSLRHISAFAANLTINLEPVYGIILAWVLLHENRELSAGFYIGVAVISVAVFSYPWLKKNFDRRNV